MSLRNNKQFLGVIEAFETCLKKGFICKTVSPPSHSASTQRIKVYSSIKFEVKLR